MQPQLQVQPPDTHGTTIGEKKKNIADATSLVSMAKYWDLNVITGSKTKENQRGKEKAQTRDKRCIL